MIWDTLITCGGFFLLGFLCAVDTYTIIRCLGYDFYMRKEMWGDRAECR